MKIRKNKKTNKKEIKLVEVDKEMMEVIAQSVKNVMG